MGAITLGKENKLLEHWLLGKHRGVQQDDVISVLCASDVSTIYNVILMQKAVWLNKKLYLKIDVITKMSKEQKT